MFPRSLLTHIRYLRFRRRSDDSCGFCNAHTDKTPQFLKEFEHTAILANLFPYTRWDGWKVGEHRMVIPIRHVTSLADLTAEESLEIMKVVTEYEAKGYSFYIRSHANKSKSMPHLHGHLIKSR